jgi:rhodanese-related sulfurtransferase
VVVVDVRSAPEYALEHIANSINISLDDLARVEKNYFKDKIVVFHCKGGIRTKSNEHLLQTFHSKQSYCLSGGIEQWKCCGFKVVTN